MASLATALCVVGACCAGPAIARDYTLKSLRIDHPYARPTPPGARTAGAYFTIENRGSAADRLLRVASPLAGSVELHSMTMDGNLMRMRAVGALDIPPGGKVTLSPGGYHAMLVGVKRPLALGDKVPLTLTFEKAGAIDVDARVEAAAHEGATKSEHAH